MFMYCCYMGCYICVKKYWATFFSTHFSITIPSLQLVMEIQFLNRHNLPQILVIIMFKLLQIKSQGIYLLSLIDNSEFESFVFHVQFLDVKCRQFHNFRSLLFKLIFPNTRLRTECIFTTTILFQNRFAFFAFIERTRLRIH